MKISKEVKVGAIALVTMIIFGGLFKFLQGQNIFQTGRVFYVKYENVDGLLPTKPVNINGLRVGKVDDIYIKEGKDNIYFLVKMTINEDIKFSKNTVAEIYEPGILAGKMIQLDLKFDGELAQDGDTLVAANNESLIDIVSNKIKPTQNKLDSVLITLNNTLGKVNNIVDEETNQSLKSILKSLDASIQAMGATANSIKTTSESADILLSNTNKAFGDIANTANSTMKKYGDVADKFNDSKLDETLLQLNEISKSLKTTLTRIENSDGTLNKVINDKELYENLNKTASNLNILLGDLKENPDRYMQFSVFGKKAKQKK